MDFRVAARESRPLELWEAFGLGTDRKPSLDEVA
jgi:hypothetical protein